MRRGSAMLLGLGALLLGTAASADTSRTIFYNGKIFTANPAMPFAQAVAVHEDQIQAVGSNPTILALSHPGTQLVNLHGRTVIPGLNDAHVHALSPGGTYLNTPDFVPGPGPTLPEVLSLVAAGAGATPPGTWLVVRVGTNITEDEDANRFSLDTVSPNHPVKLEVWTGHGTYLNTKGLKTLGISEQEPDPMGGHYTRIPGSQVITGEAHEYAEHLIRRKLYQVQTNAALAQRYREFASQALAFGFTSVQDMAIGLRHDRTLEVLEQANLPIRVRSICFPLTVTEACSLDSDDIPGFPRIKASGIKWITDGTPVERLAFLNEPYLDKPDTVGEFNFTDNALGAMLFRGLLGPRARNQTLFHAVGDGAVDKVLDGLEATGGHAIWSKRRTRIEHGDLLFPENYARMLDLGAVIVQNPTHLALTAVFSQRLQPEAFAAIEPLQTLLDLGIPLALGTDGIGRAQSPWVDIFLAAIHPTRPSEAITVQEAITAYTAGSAYAEFEEDHKGTLAPGMKADLAVLSQDVFTVPVFALPSTSSVLTMVNGKVVFTDPATPL